VEGGHEGAALADAAGHHDMAGLDAFDGDHGEVGTDADGVRAARDDRRMSGGDELELVGQGLGDGTARRRPTGNSGRATTASTRWSCSAAGGSSQARCSVRTSAPGWRWRSSRTAAVTNRPAVYPMVIRLGQAAARMLATALAAEHSSA
jgi:hypothetical protein